MLVSPTATPAELKRLGEKAYPIGDLNTSQVCVA